jgi:hypothetical protein
MPIMIDEFSIKPLYLETFLGQLQLGVATGFVVKKNENYFLVTNWHVATGRNPSDNLPLSRSGLADPNKLKVWFHGQNLGQWVNREIDLVNRNGENLWLEHKLHERVDVIALQLTVTKEVKIYEIDLALANFDLTISPSEAVSILGFPMGLTSGGKFPIWKTGHVASDMDIDWDNKPVFLIDATTKSGMSGSPVIAKRVGNYQSSSACVNAGDAVRFLGVYSGREADEYGVEVGLVWKPRVISEILSGK